MSASFGSNQSWLPWSPHPDDERRLFNSQLSILLPLAVLAALLPFLPVFITTIVAPVEIAAVVTLVTRPPPRPQPPQPQGGGAEVKPEPRPIPRPAPVKPRPAQTAEAARARAARSGLLALGNELSTLRDSPVLSSIEGERSLRRGVPQGQTSGTATLSEGVDRGSGGISTTGVGQSASEGTALREGGTGTRGAGTTAGGTGGGSGGGTGGRGVYTPKRTSESIQLIIDRNKAAFESIYQRALRQNPALQGAVVFEMTIEPSGRVAACRIVSSELRDAALEAKLVERLRVLNFGAEQVPTITVTNPLRFYPR